MINSQFIVLLIVLQSTAKILLPGMYLVVFCVTSLVSYQDDVKVIITSLEQCKNKVEYPVEVFDIMVKLNKGNIAVTGTLTTLLDITTPIKAVLKVEKYEWLAWVEIPCVNRIGSCMYDDICIYGVPLNETCPESFVSNNVPCRCPIPKGNYTIPSSLGFEINSQSINSIYSGKYWANIHIIHQGMDLTCYNVKFTITDSIHGEIMDIDNDYDNFDAHDEDIPVVILV